jgi:hypothetical protein
VVTNTSAGWLLLVYTVPREPTANRVSTWRKLKRLGAMLVHDAVWVLPNSARTSEQFQWLASDIRDLGGEALIWQGSLAPESQDEALKRKFLALVDTHYAEILAALEQPDADRTVLSRRYQQAKAQDYFNSPLGQRVREVLLEASGGAACSG